MHSEYMKIASITQRFAGKGEFCVEPREKYELANNTI